MSKPKDIHGDEVVIGKWYWARRDGHFMGPNMEVAAVGFLTHSITKGFLVFEAADVRDEFPISELPKWQFEPVKLPSWEE